VNEVTPTQVGATIQVDFADAHNLAVGILRSMQEYDVTVAQGAASAALVLGHLMSTGDLSDDDAVKFVHWVIEQSGMYFSEGSVN
jgi:hypothetical protein